MGEAYTFLVIGKTGTGKSTVCNTILGREAFKTGNSMDQITQETKPLTNARMTVIDTPDLKNIGITVDEIKQEIDKWQKQLPLQNSAILVAVRCDVRYTTEEYEIYQQIKHMWGRSAFKERLVVVFTFGDRLQGDLEQGLKRAGPDLQHLMRNAKRRHVCFNSQVSDKGPQVQELLRQVGKCNRKGAGCFG